METEECFAKDKMPVNIPKSHLDICDSICDELNKVSKRFSFSNYNINIQRYEQELFKRNYSVCSKKALLLNHLHKLLVNTFAFEPSQIKINGRLMSIFKNRITLLRNTVLKLRDINYYLNTIYLKELNLIRNTPKKRKARAINRISGKDGYLAKSDMERLEVTVFRMIERIIYLDQKLLKKYKGKVIKLIYQSKYDIEDLEEIIAKESEILCHIEAKLPPANKLNRVILRKSIFTEWVSRIFALLSGLEYEYEREQRIFLELRKNGILRKELNKKISNIIKEKFTLLKLQEKKLLISSKKKIGGKHHIVLHDYTSALKL